MALRGEVSKAVEEARSQKVIGHSLDASVTMVLPQELLEIVRPVAEELRAIFIVSQVSISTEGELGGAYQSERIPGLAIGVDRAPGEKCERCWIYDLSVGTDAVHETICSRCVDALKAGNGGD
jgi:isoleucyl-tRNA synthetase